MTLLCDIVTPEKLIYSEEIVSVSLPGSEGDFGVLQRRAAIMSTLRPGEIRVIERDGTKPLRFAVSGGYAENDGSKVVVLAARAARLDELVLEDVRGRKGELEREVAGIKEDDPHAAFKRAEFEWYTLVERLLVQAL